VILLRIGKTKLECKKQDNTVKQFKANAASIAKAKSDFRIGDAIFCKFDPTTFEIIEISKPEAKGSYNGGKGGYNGKKSFGGTYNTKPMVFGSILNLVSNFVEAKVIKTVKEAKEAIAELMVQGVELTKADTVKKAEEKDEFADDGAKKEKPAKVADEFEEEAEPAKADVAEEEED
jgi:hypothetical protein